MKLLFVLLLVFLVGCTTFEYGCDFDSDGVVDYEGHVRTGFGVAFSEVNRICLDKMNVNISVTIREVVVVEDRNEEDKPPMRYSKCITTITNSLLFIFERC